MRKYELTTDFMWLASWMTFISVYYHIQTALNRIAAALEAAQ